MKTAHMRVCVAVVGTLLGVASAFSQGYTIRDLGTLGGPTAEAFGLNKFGQVVGASTVADANLRGFFRDANGALTPIPPLAGDTQLYAEAINDAGQVAGVSFDMGGLVARGVRWQNGLATDLGDIAPRGIDATGRVVGYLSTKLTGFGWVDHAALWQAGSIVDLGTLGGHWSYAAGVADDGRIVGMSFLSDDLRRRATLWQNGVPQDLGTLGGPNSFAYDVNNAGEVVGVADTAAGAPHAFLFALSGSGNVINRTDLGALGGDFSYAYGINDAGTVVGTSYNAAFVWQDGVMSDLNALIPAGTQWRLDAARAINSRGQIVGYGLHLGQPRAFLATPNVLGDMNCDGVVTFADIDPFVAALGGQAAYDQVVADCNWLNADCNHDAQVSFKDIDPFVGCLSGHCP